MIYMIGIDYTKANLDQRASFGFTTETKKSAYAALHQQEILQGAVLLATCNRTELYLHLETEVDLNTLIRIFCAMKSFDSDQVSSFVHILEGKHAISHLFHVAAGLKSAILAEDQILTQTKEALKLARECKSSDGTMEVLFRMAVTAAKRIKTKLTFIRSEHTAADQLLHKEAKKDLKEALIIGNGEMGRLCAEKCIEAGIRTTITLRSYRKKAVTIPMGCLTIPYENRYEKMPEVDLIISATTSPHFTIRAEKFSEIHFKNNVILADMAMPRDIDPAIRDFANVIFYDLDDFQSEQSHDQNQKSMEAADEIISAQMQEFQLWEYSGLWNEDINRIRELAGHEAAGRIQKQLHRFGDSKKLQTELSDLTASAANRTVGKLLYLIRDQLSPEVFLQCMKQLRSEYEEEI